MQISILILSKFFQIQKVIGVKVWNLAPDSEKIVSLIWPTLIPYDRIGYCKINLITHKSFQKNIDDQKTIHFNTSLNAENLPDYLSCN